MKPNPHPRPPKLSIPLLSPRYLPSGHRIRSAEAISMVRRRYRKDTSKCQSNLSITRYYQQGSLSDRLHITFSSTQLLHHSLQLLHFRCSRPTQGLPLHMFSFVWLISCGHEHWQHCQKVFSFFEPSSFFGGGGWLFLSEFPLIFALLAGGDSMASSANGIGWGLSSYQLGAKEDSKEVRTSALTLTGGN